MKKDMRKEIEEILENAEDARECKHCEAVWVVFTNPRNGHSGFLRLANDSPSECPICSEFNDKLESRTDLLYSKEEGKI